MLKGTPLISESRPSWHSFGLGQCLRDELKRFQGFVILLYCSFSICDGSKSLSLCETVKLKSECLSVSVPDWGIYLCDLCNFNYKQAVVAAIAILFNSLLLMDDVICRESTKFCP